MLDTEGELGALVLRRFGSLLRQSYSFQSSGDEKCKDKISFVSPFSHVGINIVPYENINIVELIESDNKVINKILAVFSSLCLEVQNLEEEALQRHFKFLISYQEFIDESEYIPQELISANIESLHNLLSFVSRCQEVCLSITTQIFALYGSGLMHLSGIHLHYIFKTLGDLLVIMVKIEALINDGVLMDHWRQYRKAIKAMHQCPERYNLTNQRLMLLESILDKLQSQILSDKIMQNALDNLLNLRKNLAEKNCSLICGEFLHYIKKSMAEMERFTNETCESHLSIKWVEINSLFVLHNHLFGNIDKKLFKTLVDLNLKIPSIPLYGTTLWYPEQFLQKHLPVLCETHRKLSQLTAKARQNYLMTKKQTISQDVSVASMEINRWSLAMGEAFQDNASQLTSTQMNLRLQLLLQGANFASQINFTINCLIALHTSRALPMTKSMLLGICSLIEILKGIYFTFSKRMPVILHSSLHISQHLTFQSINLIVNTKKTLMTTGKNYARQQLDELTVFVVAERVLCGPCTSPRRVIANVALAFVPSARFSESTYGKLTSLLNTIDSFVNIENVYGRFCSLQSFSWLRSIMPIYLSNIYSTKQDPKKLCLLFKTIEESCNFVCSDKISSNKTEKYNKEISSYLNDQVLKPLCHQVETNLRLNIHSHLQVDAINPFHKQSENTQSLLSMNDFIFMREYISVSKSIENYLSFTFYNLTTVILHDWKTYGEMRQLAKFKYDLETVEDHLPTQTLEQGLDVLEIMRNIHIFVSKYFYNLNNQIFIEQSSNNKHLNTINIKHVANSIRTHGTGIMNTTVNFTYQFLKKKFFTFSQFMYDEHIKSRLMKDFRYFRETCAASDNMYGYKRADKFNKGIRNLGMTENNQSYLDLFRVLIGQIGNAMGYVRMIRSGGLHCCANATVFLPALDESTTFKDVCERDNLSSEAADAAGNLDHAVDNLLVNFSRGTEYFKLLVDVFAPVFRNPKNVHLRNFYMIVPPLTINYVENMISSKDRMTKKNKIGAAFTDDGFAMGLAYILRLLDQDAEIDSLHWFESVWKHISDEFEIIKEEHNRGSAQLQQALALSERKLGILQTEFELLFYSFSSARIFFQ